MKKLLIIDGNSFIFRAFYATYYSGSVMKTKDNVPTNAVFGYINFIEAIINNSNPDYIFIALDKGSNTFRKKLYEPYKAQRDKAPSELQVQFSIIREYMNKRNISWLEDDNYEADDIIGSVANKYKETHEIEIYTGDRDYLQLCSENVEVSLIKKGGLKEVVTYTPKLVMEEYGVTPKAFIDMKAIMGDKSDNIPGVLGIGEKGALKYLLKYKTLEEIYENIENEKQNKTTEKFILNKENAFLSKQLATIKLDIVNLDLNIEKMKKSLNSETDFINFLKKYELNTIVKKFILEEDKTTEKVEILFTKELEKLDSPVIEIITTLEDSYHFNQIKYLGIKSNNKYYKLEGHDLNKENLENIFLSNSIIFDAKKVKTILKNNYNLDVSLTNDVMLKSYILNSEQAYPKIEKYSNIFDYDINSNKDIFKIIKKEEDERIIEQELFNRLNLIEEMNITYTKKIDEEKIGHLLELEQKVMNVLYNMEQNGIRFNKDTNNEMKLVVDEKISILEQEIYNLAGEEFNLKSPKQLGVILFEKLGIETKKRTKTKSYSTSADVLESLVNVNPIIPLILEFRTLSKLSTTYLHSFEKFLKDDNKIHTTYNQVGTTTGRLSSNYPNLQNIPSRIDLGRKIRKSFIVKSNRRLLSIDYSQIELRIISSIANEENMINSFNNLVDIHSDTASKVFMIPIEEVNPTMRKMAKVINFGILYGMGAFKLATDLGIKRKEAEEFITRYLDTYPNIKKYIENQKIFAQKNEYVTTILDRKRYVKNINDNNKMIQSLNQRIAVNSPIQGSAAEILKLSMIKIQEYIDDNNIDAKIILQIHDELVFEISDDNFEDVASKFIKIMENIYNLNVKLECNYKSGYNWYEMK